MTYATGMPPPIAFAGEAVPLLIMANGKEVLSIDRDHIALHGKRVDDSGAVHRALVTALLGPGCAPVWQAIQSAPTDGTHVLAWDGDVVEVVYWNALMNRWSCADESNMLATHWMPLPAPPR